MPVISTGEGPNVTDSQPLGSRALTGPPDSVLNFIGASHMCASLVVTFTPAHPTCDSDAGITMASAPNFQAVCMSMQEHRVSLAYSVYPQHTHCELWKRYAPPKKENYMYAEMIEHNNIKRLAKLREICPVNQKDT
eukprot:scaffold447164_cov40-Prasinocladus_malaysianus.AAC.1